MGSLMPTVLGDTMAAKTRSRSRRVSNKVMVRRPEGTRRRPSVESRLHDPSTRSRAASFPKYRFVDYSSPSTFQPVRRRPFISSRPRSFKKPEVSHYVSPSLFEPGSIALGGFYNACRSRLVRRQVLFSRQVPGRKVAPPVYSLKSQIRCFL